MCENKLDIDAKCHTKRCHLELNETFMPPPWPIGEDVDSRFFFLCQYLQEVYNLPALFMG